MCFPEFGTIAHSDRRTGSCNNTGEHKDTKRMRAAVCSSGSGECNSCWP